MENYINITADNITKYLDANEIVILDFWASRCTPCLAFTPIYEKVAALNPDIIFGKVNTEVDQVLSMDFDIRSIPTLVILKKSTIIFQESGVIPEYALKSVVTKARSIDPESL